MAVIRWTDCYSHFSFQISGLWREFFQRKDLDHDIGFSMAQLSMSCTYTSDSVAFLVRSGRMWDADILIRSLVEGSMKFAFLCIKDPLLRIQRNVEYSTVLPNMAEIRRQRHLEDLMKQIPNQSAPEWEPFRRLRMAADKIRILEAKYPRRLRSRMQQNWSFTNIVSELVQTREKGMEALAGFLFFYGTSSHIVHKDSDGVGIMWERSTRSVERRMAVELAHAARQVSDILTLSQLRMWFAYSLAQISTSPLQFLEKEMAPLLAELQTAQESWQQIEFRR